MSNKMWGSRFSSGPDAIMEDINASIDFDKRLYAQDILGSKVHCQMLAATGIINSEDAGKILHGLDTILSEIEAGEFEFLRALEDIHMNVESRLSALVGDAAGRLHTARSRNDQVALDFRLYVRDTALQFEAALCDLQLALAQKALEFNDALMPGFTHLQTAQPITFGHHCLAYVEMFGRDRSRMRDARVRMNECPLGAAALAGTSFAIDRHMTAQQLGFDQPMANSMDAVASRDFVLELLSASAIAAVNLSRLAEEIVIWCSAPFKFVTLSDRFSTGSSIMPQKRNPDAAELVRAKAGRIIAALTGLLIVMKGLPLTYSKDMQEDKEQAFDAFDSLNLGLAAMAGMIRDLQPQVDNMKKYAASDFSTATDLADWLVRVADLPFRQAHHVTGQLVAMASARNINLHEIPLADMQKVEAQISQDIYNVLSAENSVNSRTSYGGTAPENVKHQALRWLDILQANDQDS